MLANFCTRIPSHQFIGSCHKFRAVKYAGFWKIATTIDHQKNLAEIIGNRKVLWEQDDIQKYTTDWTRCWKGGSFVCLPESTEDVAKILKYCNDNDVPVVPQGGNTGLVGGSVGTSRNEVILSLSRMNKIINVDKNSAVVTCEAGCVLEVLNSEMEQYDLFVPLDIAAKGSCLIGGNVSTNAGGLRVIKYGSLHGNVLGLEVVKADGTVLDLLRTVRKDNSGYDLKQLFIGSEGTLGVITKVSLLLAPKPIFSNVIVGKLKSFGHLPEVLQLARSSLGAGLTAFEYLDRNSAHAFGTQFPADFAKIPSNILPDFQSGDAEEVNVVVECTGSDPELDSQRMDKFATALVEHPGVVDAVLSQNGTQEKELWKLRENISISLTKLSLERQPLVDVKLQDGSTAQTTLFRHLFKYDISVKLGNTMELIKQVQDKLHMKWSMDGFASTHLTFCNFGHIADENLHLNILADIIVVESPPKEQTGRWVTYQGLIPSPNNRHFAAQGTAVVQNQYSSHLQLLQETIDDAVFDVVHHFQGSFSAEHGIGQQKRHALYKYKTKEEIELMKSLKQMMDPKNILNPGKVI